MTRETTIVGGEVRQESVSDEISRAVKGASAQIDRIDHNPLIRLALARVTIRCFAHHIAGTFPDDLETLAREVEKSGAWLDACDAYGTPSRHAAGREELERLEQAFAELSDEEQNVILWSRFCGMKHDEIAEAIGKTPVATRKVLSRALAKLAEWLDD